MLLTLLPLAGFAAENVKAVLSANLSKTYDGNEVAISTLVTSVKANNGEGDAVAGYTFKVDGTAATTIPAQAGTYTVDIILPDGNTWAAENSSKTFEYTVVKKQVVYFLTGSTYAIGDKPVVTNHYSLATAIDNAFVGTEKLDDYAEFEFATSGNDALDLDKDGRFTKITTYNIKALRVVEKNVPQNYDFRFTSTAAIVVTAKSIAAFLSDAVENQKYTGSRIEPQAPAIYASAEDQNANPKIALDKSNYDVTYVSTSNANKDRNNIDVAKGGVIVYTGKGNYEGTLEVPFNIIPRPLTSVTVGTVDNQTYNYGAAIEPALTVTGKGDDNKDYPLTLTTDYTVDYDGSNINAGNATGTLAVAGGNFSLVTNAQVAQAKFVIEPKNLGDEDITINMAPIVADKDARTYTGAQIKPEPAVNWTIGDDAHVITSFIKYNYGEATDNIAVGKGYVTIEPKAVEAPAVQNYKGSKTASFDILPTALGEGVTIAFKKNVGTAQEPNWQNATYSYVAREIKPGTVPEDGVLEVKDADNVLKAGEDYEIVSYGDDTHDNTNAGNNKGLVTIKGIGNYGKISALGEPITKSQEFNIAKAIVTVTAGTPVTTTFGVAPVFSATNDAFESIGGKYTYTVEQNNGTDEQPNWVEYNGDLTALAVGEYRYTPAWVATDVEPEENPDEHETYSTAEEVAARANYDLTYSEGAYTHFVYVPGVLTVNNAKWIIVPDDQEKKYGVEDAALTFTYKVYAGDENDEQTWVPVNNADFDEDPIIGRPANIGTTPNNGENVLEGGYKIAVLNQTGDHAVAKAGYEIVCKTGTLNIVPFEITLTANDQTIYFGGEPNTDVTDDSFIKDVENGDEDGNGTKLTVTFAPVMLANGSLIDRDELDLSLTWDQNSELGSHTDALVPAISKMSTNFTVKAVTKGKVTVLQNPVLELNDALATNYTTIKAYKGKTKNVAVTIHNRQQTVYGTTKSFKWNAKQYNMLVLPFPVTAREISEQLGYAVVYRANKDKATDTDIYFSLAWDVPAHEPFAVKIDEDAPAEQTLHFQNKTISDPATAYPSVDAGNGFKLVGAYETFTIDATSAGKYRFFGDGKHNGIASEGKSWNVIPFDGYIDLTGSATAPELVTITFEGEDGNGSATAIRSIESVNTKVAGEGWYNLNGMQLENAPAQKGVYIQNGKKVIIK